VSNELCHFAVNADDVERARAFYASVFGWTIFPWGPPGFYAVRTKPGDGPATDGAIQQRREIVPGKPMFGLECTFGVADVDAIAAAVEAAGGKIVMPKVTIPGICDLIFFEDTEGNVAGAARYHTA